MKIWNKYKLLPAAAILIAGSLTFLWLGARTFEAGSGGLCAGFLGIVLICLCGSLTHLLLRERKQHEEFKRYIEALCSCHLLNGLNDNAPSLASDHSYSDLSEKIHKTILDNRRRVQELEHARTTQDVRCLRAISQAEQIKNIFEGLTDPILVIDDYDELLLANHSAEEIFHFKTEKIETRALKKIVRCQKLIDLLTCIRQRKIIGARSEDIELADENGKSQWFHATACKLAGADDNAPDKSPPSQGAVVVLRDIGDQRILQKRNAEFVSSVSHEMKTPLAGIKAYVELLADGDVQDENTRNEFLNVIAAQADRLNRLVENMLNIARIEAGVVNVNKLQYSLNDILEEAMHVVQLTAEAKNIKLVPELSSLYLGVLADRDMLLQAAINLLSNAIKYTSEGGSVILRSRSVGDRVLFEVQDTGVGLSPEECRLIFEKFYRVSRNKDMAPGTGLGLSLAKHIVEDVHGGQLVVESTLGVGSTFSVTMHCANHLKNEL